MPAAILRTLCFYYTAVLQSWPERFPHVTFQILLICFEYVVSVTMLIDDIQTAVIFHIMADTRYKSGCRLIIKYIYMTYISSVLIEKWEKISYRNFNIKCCWLGCVKHFWVPSLNHPCFCQRGDVQYTIFFRRTPYVGSDSDNFMHI